MTAAAILATHPDHPHVEGICKPWLDRMGAPDQQQAANDLRAAGWRFTKAGARKQHYILTVTVASFKT